MASKKPKQAVAEGGVADDKESSQSIRRKILADSGKWLQRPCRNDDEVEERISEYKSIIALQEPAELPLVETLAQYLGISYHKFRKFVKGEEGTERRQALLQGAVTWIAGVWGQLVTVGDLYFGVYVWYSKQWFDMREPDSKLVLDAVSPLKELASSKDIAQKYLADLGEDTPEKPKSLPDDIPAG